MVARECSRAVIQETAIEARKPSLLVSVLKWAGIGVGLLVVLTAAGAAYLRWFSPLDRDWVIKALADHYECDVELKDFHSSLFPAVRVSGEGLVLRRRDAPGLPPMASIDRFSVAAYWVELLRHPRHFSDVRLEGLTLNIPPRHGTTGSGTNTASTADTAAKKKKIVKLPFVLDNVLADGATLNIISSKPDKPPTVFAFQKLRLQSAGAGPPMRFEAVLTNPRPKGQIQSSGKFGPWNADDPSQTPINGKYTFDHVDLSTIKGLEGTLSSDGTYDGVLNYINVHGETKTPNFALSISGNPVPLRTKFEAVVDGVSGNTFLRPVTAQLLSSTIVAQGGVARTNGRPGRTIMLDVTASPARLEDLMRLAIKSSKPFLTGNVSIRAKLDLPPGEEDIGRRLNLDGEFNIDSARFTNPDTQDKLRTISRIGLGKHNEDDTTNAPLSMKGRFTLGNGVAKFSTLDFSIPGAELQLHGTFGLDDQTLDFEGTASMQATVSEMTTGVKSKLLRVIDPLLSKDGKGTVVPIQITGTRADPEFHVEVGKILHRIH